MLKNNHNFKWTLEAQREFANNKECIASSLVLVSIDFDRHFILYHFSFEFTIATILTQKNEKGEEFPIFFMSKEFHDYELRYSPLEKQDFALVRVVSHLKPYILSILVKAYIPLHLVKMMVSLLFQEGRWTNWLAKLQEFDIEVRPLKVVK